MSYEFTGKVVHIGEKETFPSGFYKRIVVIDDEADNYPQQIPFEFLKQMADKLDSKGIREGDKVTVRFDLQGREYNGRWFGSLKAWDVNRMGETRRAEPKDEVQRQLDETLDEETALDEDVPF